MGREDDVELLILCVLVAAPIAVVVAAAHAPDLCTFVLDVFRRARAPLPQPFRSLDRPLERLAADLRRLADDLDTIAENPNLPGRMERMEAFGAAYDDTLLAACRALGVSSEARTPMSGAERLQAEVELTRQGLRW